jgi:hypothetical protein
MGAHGNFVRDVKARGILSGQLGDQKRNMYYISGVHNIKTCIALQFVLLFKSVEFNLVLFASPPYAISFEFCAP